MAGLFEKKGQYQIEGFSPFTGVYIDRICRYLTGVFIWTYWSKNRAVLFYIERIKLESFHFDRTGENKDEKYNPFTGKFIWTEWLKNKVGMYSPLTDVLYEIKI